VKVENKVNLGEVELAIKKSKKTANKFKNRV